MKFKQILPFLLITTALSSCTQPDSTSTVRAANGGSASSASEVPQRWTSTNLFPLNLKISDEFSADEKTGIADMATEWSSSVNNELTFFNTSVDLNTTEKSSLSSYNDSNLGVYKVSDWDSSLPSSALAVTQIFGFRRNTGSTSEYIEITHADILINYDTFDTQFTTDENWGYDLETVVLHEMGHFLGLYHEFTSVDQSVMYPTINQYTDNRSPKDQDITNIRHKYIGGSQSAAAYITDATGPDEPIQIFYEMMSDGSERVRTINKGKQVVKHLRCKKHKH